MGTHVAPRRQRIPAVRPSMLAALALPAAFVVSTVPGVRAVPGYDLALDGWLNNLAYASAPVICLLRARTTRGRERTAGYLLALALALYGGGNVFWTVVVRTMDPEPFPSGADALFLAFYPFAFAALMIMRGQHNQSLQLSEWLDGLVGGLAAAALAAAVLVQPLIDVGEGSWDAVATTTAYPLLDLVLLLIVVTVLSLFRWRPPVGIWLLALGLILFGIADVQYLVATAGGAYASGGLNDGVWVIAVTIMGASPGWAAKPKGPHLPTWSILVIPTASACTALALLVQDHLHPLHPISMGLATATLGLALLRLIVTVREVNTLAHSRQLALTDELTGLGNRRALFELAPERIARTPAGQDVALLLLDLDRFKEVNDTLGHHAGDAMLRVVAARLVTSVQRPDIHLVRLGGDEFAFLLTGVDVEAAQACAQNVHDALVAPVKLDGVTVWVGASIGISSMPAGGADLTTMLRQADVAMYQAKAADDTSVVVYSAERDSFAHTERLETIELLRHAIGAREMVVHYQPKIDSHTKEVQGAEALVRWNHPTRGLLHPDSFLALLEDIGLMRELTLCVLDIVLDQLVLWKAVGRHLTVSVNLPASAMVDLGLPERVAELLAVRGLDAECLEIEITEDFLMRDRDRARDILGRLRAQGIRIAVDDFGTGYSSLSYLKELPVDVLKLDKSFLRDIHVDPRAMAIVQSTIGLAHSLGLNMVAEGVEDDATSARLAASGCDLEQGWLYSKALPPAELEAWLDVQGDRPDGDEQVPPARRPAWTPPTPRAHTRDRVTGAAS